MADVSLKKVVKRFGAYKIIHGADLEVADGEFVVFVGPSGCGKSTLLRMIAGLEDITEGEVSIGGKVVNDVEPADRGVAMVFQSYALYPHMTVEQNLSFGLRMTGNDKADTARRVKRTAEILRIAELLDRRPRQLSGGQRQRVAIGRAIMREPQLFLFDEPLSNLDAELRVQMRVETRQAPQGARRDHDLCDARPDRGDDAGRPDRRSARRLDRADRPAARPLRRSGQPVCRWLRWLTENELYPRPRGRADSEAASSSSLRARAAPASRSRLLARPRNPAAR